MRTKCALGLLLSLSPMIAGAAMSSEGDAVAPYLSPKQLMQVGRGRSINVVCLGHGSPTVILSSGMGGWSLDWASVQPELAKRTKVCAWDRAGAGFSGPSEDPQDSLHTTRDLERALKTAGIGGPYVMVAHSLGAYEALLFTDHHRDSVVGMVLLDPDLLDRPAVDERLAPQFAALSKVLESRDVSQRLKCATSMQSGELHPGMPAFDKCTAAPVRDSLPQLKEALTRLNADPKRLLTQASLQSEHYNSSRQAANASRRYGDMPLVVLTAGLNEASVMSSIARLPPGTPGTSTPEETDQLKRQVSRFLREGSSAAHEGYAALSTRGQHRVVADSTHDIAAHRPDAVIDAVADVLASTGKM